MTDLSLREATPRASFPVDKGAVVIAVVALFVGALTISAQIDPRQAVLFVIGALLGVTLFHASFGFAGGWRRFIVERRGRAMRAQMLMIAVTAVVFLPLIAAGDPLGRPLAGAIAPAGVAVLAGAAMFGLGMQLSGGCGSGTLFTLGGGNARMLVTLLFFVVGALAGTAHLPWWLQLPSLPPMGLGAEPGVVPAISVTLAGLGLVAGLTVLIERRAHGGLEMPPSSSARGVDRLIHGPWPLVLAGLALAGLNVATLLIAGHPWSVTYGFALWGAKAAQSMGVPVADWTFWTWPVQARALKASVLQDITSVMNFGIMLGAALAAGLAGRFALKVPVPFALLVAAALGGALMGYGARLSFGCNIGALFSGIASGSLHGWLWFAAAFAGSFLGIALRPLFGLEGFKSR